MVWLNTVELPQKITSLINFDPFWVGDTEYYLLEPRWVCSGSVSLYVQFCLTGNEDFTLLTAKIFYIFCLVVEKVVSVNGNVEGWVCWFEVLKFNPIVIDSSPFKFIEGFTWSLTNHV